MRNFKKFSLLICFFLIVNQDIIGHRQHDGSMVLKSSTHLESNTNKEVYKTPSSKPPRFLNLPHTSIYLK
jgi:hypothetical protein